MRKITLLPLFKQGLLLCLTTILLSNPLSAQSIVEKHGRLQVDGNRVVDKNGEVVSLAGNSLFWSNAGDTADFYNVETVEFLSSEWNSSLIRAAMGVRETWDGGNGYIDSPEAQEAKIRKVIDAAIDQGIYVIIDWHTHEAEKYTAESVAFFTKMARIYGDTPNVIYEIYNEPINQSWPVIKDYAEEVIAGIRSEDPDNLIIVGTTEYSQQVDVASENPIADNNVAYTLHFYAAFRGHDKLRATAQRALDNGAALFVTEWGTILNTGRGEPDPENTAIWMDFLKEKGISHANWSVSDKAFPETGSVVQGGRGLTGLRNDQLTTSGALVKDIIQNWDSAVAPDPDPDPSDDGVCETIDCIRRAMANAAPGNEIIVKSGIYKMTDKIKGAFDRNVYLHSDNNGTASRPIVLRGENPSNPPIIEGIAYNDGYLLSIEGDYWEVRDMEFRTGSKGIVLDNANNGKLINLEVHDVGEEGIHLRDDSSNNLVDGCTVYDTGRVKAGFGEGLYVGSDKGQHDAPYNTNASRRLYGPACNNNTFQNCTVGPNVTAEGVDIKEGTRNTIIRNSTFSAEGITGENSADAFIDLKGALGFVYGNTFNVNGSPIINAGVDFLDRGTGVDTGFRNAIFDNTFNLGARAGEIQTARKKQGDPTETHVWDNKRNPASQDFPVSDGTEGFVTESCPSWNILPCEGGGGSDENEQPIVSFNLPNGNQNLPVGYDLEVNVEAEDADGDIANVKLFIDNNLVRQENFVPYEWGHAGSPNPEELNGLAVGTYIIKAVATDDKGETGEASFTLTVTDESGGNTGDCDFATPTASGLPSINTSYENVYVLGGGGPSMENFREFTINWNAPNNGLYQFAFNTNDGVPRWYINFSDKATYQFKNANPEITLDNTGIAGLDGSYWVTVDGDNFVMVSKSAEYSLYFSNASSAPTCATAQTARLEVERPVSEGRLAVYPNPVSDILQIANDGMASEVRVTDMQGQVLKTETMTEKSESISLGALRPGMYIVEIRTPNGTLKRKVIKQ